MRLFVALIMPEEVKQAAAGMIADLKRAGADIKWVDPANLHLTLKFLGAVEDGLLPALTEALDGALAGRQAMEFTVQGCGAFPGAKRPQVVWLGLEGQTGPLAELSAALERACEPLGLAPEGRAFRAHLTLGRLRRGRGPSTPLAPLVRALAGRADWQGPAFTARRVELMHSTLTPPGPIYRPLRQWELTP